MKKNIIVSILVIFSFAFVATVWAQEAPVSVKARGVNSSTIANVCQILTQKIDTNVAKFDNNKSRHDKVFNGLQTKISSIIKSLDAKGIDTGNLKADLAVLVEKVQKFQIDYQAYHEMLRATKEFACGQSNGQFVSKIAEAKKLLPAVRKDILDIKSFYQTTIRPDIVELRDQMRVRKTSSTPSTTVSSSTPSSTIISE